MNTLVVLLYDPDCGCYGASEPMNERECDKFLEDAISNGYNVCCVCLNDLFNDGHQKLDVYYCK